MLCGEAFLHAPPSRSLRAGDPPSPGRDRPTRPSDQRVPEQRTGARPPRRQRPNAMHARLQELRLGGALLSRLRRAPRLSPPPRPPQPACLCQPSSPASPSSRDSRTRHPRSRVGWVRPHLTPSDLARALSDPFGSGSAVAFLAKATAGKGGKRTCLAALGRETRWSVNRAAPPRSPRRRSSSSSSWL